MHNDPNEPNNDRDEAEQSDVMGRSNQQEADAKVMGGPNVQEPGTEVMGHEKD